MQMTSNQKLKLLMEAAAIAKEAAGSSVNRSSGTMATLIESTYKKMVELAESI